MGVDSSEMTRMMSMGGGGGGGSGGSQNLYTPPELATSGTTGSGGYVSQASQYISGMEAGTNLFNNWEAAQRGRMAFSEEQMSNMSSMGASGGMEHGGPVPHKPAYPMGARTNPYGALGRTTLGNGVNVSQLATPGQSGYEQGGAVGYDAGGAVPQTFDPNAGTPLAANSPQPAMTPAQAPPPQAAPAQGAPPAQAIPAQAPPQGAAPAGAPPAGAVPNQPLHPSIADPNNPAQPASPQTMFDRVVDFFHHFMHARSLSDDGVPGNAQGVPGTPSQYDVTGKVSPHSLPPDYWDKTDDQIQTAMKFGALAGHNPAQIYESLNGIRTSYTQSHMLRWLSVASRAQLDGNQDEMIQALRNANYYLPDGRNLNIQKGANGKVEYQDPVYPYIDSQGNRLTYQATPDAKPNMIPADQQYIQYVGQAMLNPMNVQQMIIGSRSAAAKQQQELLQAQGELLTGQGRAAWGQAAATKAGVDAQLAPTRAFLMRMQGVRAAADADYLGRKPGSNAANTGPKVTMASVQKAQQDAIKTVDDNVQGMQTTGQETVPGPNGQPVPNLSGTAGKQFHNSSRVPTLYQGISPDQQTSIRGIAASIAGANQGILSSQESADLAARIVKAEGSKVPPTHIDPNTKKIVRDVVYDTSNDTVHVWVGNGWKSAHLRANVLDPGDEAGIPTGHGADESTGESADTEPAADSQSMGG